MLKIGQNWGKIANYPPNAQQKSALLHPNLSYELVVFVAHIYPPVTGQRQMQTIGRSAHISF